MKRIISTAIIFGLFVVNIQAQGLKGLMNKVTKKDSTSGKSLLDNVTGNSSKAGNSLSNDDIITGLKEALRVGTDSASKKLSIANGFFGDAALKILMPAEAQKVEKTLRGFGLGSVVDKAVLSMNRAAEDAACDLGEPAADLRAASALCDRPAAVGSGGRDGR